MTTDNNYIKVALADDHIILRQALGLLVNNFGNCRVILQASDGKELIDGIARGAVPDVVILDQGMPVMDGYTAASWMYEHHPGIRILMLTIYDTEVFMIRLLQKGVKGFLKKDIEPRELKLAIEAVMDHGFYYSTHASVKLMGLLRNPDDARMQNMNFSEKEIEFIKLCTTELTYKEIGVRMQEYSTEKLRQVIFEKIDVTTRVGLVMFAIRHGIVGF